MQGFLLLDKPKGITSFGAVAKIKWLVKEKRVGHTGTLDPMATGVLPVFIGRATALSSYLLDAEKTYTAKVKLGITTDTLDITGKITDKRQVSVTDADIIKATEAFKGKIKQTPPIYSAIRKDGVRLYELARKGETAEIPEREVFIHSLDISESLDENNEFSFCATVSKGTYIRTLCSDIGQYLGCGATLTELKRTNASGFSLKNAVSLDDLTPENISDFIKPEETAISHFPAVNVTEKQAIRFSNGGQLDFERIKNHTFYSGEIVRVKYENIFLGLGIADTKKEQLAVKCVINQMK